MKRFTLAIALAIASGVAPALAQKVEVPKPQCEPKPEYPGRLAMQSDSRRRVFDREFKKYSECMKGYIEERKAAIKSHEDAASAAVDEYNAVAKKIQEEQAAGRGN